MSAVDRAAAAWGVDLPDWVIALASACDRTSQTVVARKLEYSAAVVSQVLSRKYLGGLGKVEKAVRGAFMKEVVDCPVMHTEISTHVCLINQRSGLNTATRQSVQLYRTCPICIHAEPRGNHAE